MTSMSSKILGPESEFFSKMAVDSVMSVKSTRADGKVKYPVGAINILKCHGKSAMESQLVERQLRQPGQLVKRQLRQLKKKKGQLVERQLRKLATKKGQSERQLRQQVELARQRQ